MILLAQHKLLQPKVSYDLGFNIIRDNSPSLKYLRTKCECLCKLPSLHLVCLTLLLCSFEF